MLRTLTLKSQLKFGKFASYTVDQMFQIEKNDYLCWVYYNSSNISFVPEILERLSIVHIISKPGVDKKFWDDHKGNFKKQFERKQLTIPEATFFKNLHAKTKKHKSIQHDKAHHSSKADLMYLNRKR